MKTVLLIDIQPSSVAAEWVLLTATRSKKYWAIFSGQQDCIHDYVETTVMLHYNHRRDNNVDVFELAAYNY